MQSTGYFKEPLTRQIDEAVRIYHAKDVMNRKGEWKKTAVPRATYARECSHTNNNFICISFL